MCIYSKQKSLVCYRLTPQNSAVHIPVSTM